MTSLHKKILLTFAWSCLLEFCRWHYLYHLPRIKACPYTASSRMNALACIQYCSCHSQTSLLIFMRLACGFNSVKGQNLSCTIIGQLTSYWERLNCKVQWSAQKALLNPFLLVSLTLSIIICSLVWIQRRANCDIEVVRLWTLLSILCQKDENLHRQSSLMCYIRLSNFSALIRSDCDCPAGEHTKRTWNTLLNLMERHWLGLG